MRKKEKRQKEERFGRVKRKKEEREIWCNFLLPLLENFRILLVNHE